MSTMHLPAALPAEQIAAVMTPAGFFEGEATTEYPPRDGHAPVFDVEDEETENETTATTTTVDYTVPTFLFVPSSRVRRRSELAFTRAGKASQAEEPGANYELPTLPPDVVQRSRLQPPGDLGFVTEEPTIAPTALKTDPETPGEPTPAQSLYYSDTAALTYVATVRTGAHRRLGAVHFAALCWSFFVEGWNDGSTGPLLPTIQNYYHVRATLSCVPACALMRFIIYAGELCRRIDDLHFECHREVPSLSGAFSRLTRANQGFIIGAFTIVPLINKFGFGKVSARLLRGDNAHLFLGYRPRCDPHCGFANL
jgi:hypothetical protein